MVNRKFSPPFGRNLVDFFQAQGGIHIVRVESVGGTSSKYPCHKSSTKYPLE